MKRFLCVLAAVTVMIFMVQTSSVRAGMDDCKGCHEAAFQSYAKSIHGKTAVKDAPANRGGCITCHDSGDQHIAKGGGKGTGIFAFDKKIAAKEKSAKCLACHDESRELAYWAMGKHKTGDVACSDCHKIHGKSEHYLKEKDPQLCYTCHKDVQVQMRKQSHHPLETGKMQCSSCHSPHGGFGKHMVKADSNNELCFKCHADKRGPYLYEHPPVEENCFTCHAVHGSNHPKLLVMNQPQLCTSCHEWSQHPATPYSFNDTFPGPNRSNKNVGRGCLNCHGNIHGSNGPSTNGLRFVR